ncbi:MAG TPA: T9SS type A sorting domain-containing protein [Bacteroidales bacterium]|nr:T9SS type A sorting domain-containing protein [Bacteroidales bacterium]HPI85772.1 T9SS type A sorting domain-containing protein [Bacteroidales bacterium]HPM91877.1 T9SS type A sorting domain-containing protein [Bacteroidales bacterium]
MKTKIFFLSLFLHLICFYGNTQAYNPLVLENAQWKVIQDDDATPWIDSQGGWLIRGDTLIDGVAYKKLFERAFEEPYSNVITNQGLYGFLREDTLNKTVYIIESPPGFYGCDSADQEYLLFDFSYEVGDTSQMCLHTENILSFVIEITQEYILGANRKVFQFYNSSSFIEGIGHESGLLESPVISLSGGPYYYLEEYCLGTDEECNVVYVKIDEKEQVSHYRIYPNPCRGYFYIKGMTDINENIHYSVNDVIGKEVVSGETPANSEFQIYLKEPGLYFLHIRRQGETPSCYKVVNL